MPTQLPRYKCHKIVGALKIAAVDYARQPLQGVPRGGVTITPCEFGYEPIKMDEAWAMKHRPKVGDFYVEYEDGYVSVSPGEAFESGYTRME